MIRIDNKLITKKDLLKMTGISYGQLYRWKRKNLIPETWFIRKATYTGQETFFPKEKILKRVSQITALKDTLSLDELADRFSPRSVKKIRLSKQEVLECNIVSKTVLNYYLKAEGDSETFRFVQLLSLFLLEKLLRTGKMNLDEGKELLQVLKSYGNDVSERNGRLYFIRKMGVPIFFIVAGDTDAFFESEVHVVALIHLQQSIEALVAQIENHGKSLDAVEEGRPNG